MRFNFESEEALAFDGSWSEEAVAISKGRLEALLFWWDLDMDGSGAHIISTQPSCLAGDTQPV